MQKSRLGREGGTYVGQLSAIQSGQFSGEDGEEDSSQGNGAESTLNQIIGSIEDLDKRRLAYFKKLMTKGEVFKAFRAIVSDAKV